MVVYFKDYQEAVVTVEDDYVEMEMDELNQHECMATMTAMLQHMMRNNITPAVEKVCHKLGHTQYLLNILITILHVHNTSGLVLRFQMVLFFSSSYLPTLPYYAESFRI